jgi:PAS domain S-box-containing protein
MILCYQLVLSFLDDQGRSTQAIRDQAERWQVTLSKIGDAVIVTDREGRVIFLNPVAESLCGWTDADARGLLLEAVFRIIREQTRAALENPIARVIAQGTVAGLANQTLLIAKGGTERPIADSAAPVHDQAGSITGVVLVFRDVTTQKRAKRDQAENLHHHEENTRRHRHLAHLSTQLSAAHDLEANSRSSPPSRAASGGRLGRGGGWVARGARKPTKGS